MSDEPAVILHVGGVKTGSSALQYDLTWRPVRPALESASAAYEYASLLPWQLLRGAALEQHAANFAAHYSMSDQLRSLVGQPAEGLAAGLAGLEAVRREGRVPILSYETWLTAAPADVHAFTAALGGPVRVVAYVRSPVQWLASLYYQRDYTCEPDVGRFLAKWLPKARWADAIEVWRSAPGVEAVDVRLHCGDICADFCRLVGCESSGSQIRHNQTLPAEAIRLLERHHLPSEVSLSEAKFALWRWLPDSVIQAGMLTPAPLPFDQAMISQIIAETREASRRLLGMVDADTRGRMEADPRWLSDEAAYHLPAVAATDGTPHAAQESDALAAALWQCLLAADTAWRQRVKP
jgi:hypothetical protein